MIWNVFFFSASSVVDVAQGENTHSVFEPQCNKERREGEEKGKIELGGEVSKSPAKHTPLPVLSSCHMAWRCLATLFQWRITPDGELPARSVRGEHKPKVKAAGWAADRKVWELNGRGTDSMIAPKLEFLSSLSFWDSFALAQAVLEQYVPKLLLSSRQSCLCPSETCSTPVPDLDDICSRCLGGKDSEHGLYLWTTSPASRLIFNEQKQGLTRACTRTHTELGKDTAAVKVDLGGRFAKSAAGKLCGWVGGGNATVVCE